MLRIGSNTCRTSCVVKSGFGFDAIFFGELASHQMHAVTLFRQSTLSENRMLKCEKLRDLAIDTPLPGRPAYVSAASGLVCVGDYLYVVADDENHLAMFSRSHVSPGTLLRAFDGELPLETNARKKHKPDLETLVLVPDCAEFPHGALLALGSGSKKQRDNAVLLPLNAMGAVAGESRQYDFSPVYELLREQLDGLNIEGAFFDSDDFCLLQRGNSKKAFNAIIVYDWRELFADFQAGSIGAISPRSITPVDLGNIDGVALCFTDGVALPNGDVLFSAVAEATDDAYLDGACLGAAIGICHRNGEVLTLQPIGAQYKIEGIEAVVTGNAIEILMVTDADDIAIPAVLLKARLKGLGA